MLSLRKCRNISVCCFYKTYQTSTGKGPNQIKPANSYVIANINDCVKLRTTSKWSPDPLSVPALLDQTIERIGKSPALVYKDERKQWRKITYEEYGMRVHKVAKAFIKLGLKRHHSVAVLASNCPEWFISELAAIHAGGIITGIYTTNSPAAVKHVLLSSHANIVIVDDEIQLHKIRLIIKDLPKLKTVVQILSPYVPVVETGIRYFMWWELERMNTDDVEEEFKLRMAEMAINECCCLVYTSGTVGPSKGVMLSHDNLTYDANIISENLGSIKLGSEKLISYLPLSHIAAQTTDIFIALKIGAAVYFANNDALKGSILKTLREVRPTRFIGVPRIYEKIQEKFLSIEPFLGCIGNRALNWAKAVTLEHHLNRLTGKSSNNSHYYNIVRRVIFSKVKKALGLEQSLTVLSAAAPLAPDIKKYFLSIDLPLMEAYGSSETAGAHCMTSLKFYNFETVGPRLYGVDTRIVNPDERGHGEILVRGRHVCMGYLADPEKNKEAFDADGFLATGDVGYIDRNDMLYITGRIKEIIITAGGENVPPVRIEQLVKHELYCISNAFLVGDGKKFLSILLSLKTEMNMETGAYWDELHVDTLEWLKSLGLNYTKLSEILEAGPDSIVLNAIQQGINRANMYAFSNAQRVQKFALLPHDFSVATNELGPTLKVRRKDVHAKYNKIIQKLYNE